MIDAEKKQKLIAQIKALLAKANNSAATEAEAALFAAKAHELAKKYDIEIGVDNESEITQINIPTKLSKVEFSIIMWGLGELFDCTTGYSNNNGTLSPFAIGLLHDVKMCEFLYIFIERACLEALSRYKISHNYQIMKQRGQINARLFAPSFRKGFFMRISEKLSEMSAAKKQAARVEQQYGLVLVKKKDAIQKYTENMEFKTARADLNVKIDTNGYMIGHRKAQDVELQTPLNQ